MRQVPVARDYQSRSARAPCRFLEQLFVILSIALLPSCTYILALHASPTFLYSMKAQLLSPVQLAIVATLRRVL